MPDLPQGTVTLLFTDIEGSTLLLQRLGESYTQVLFEHHLLLRAIIEKWGVCHKIGGRNEQSEKR